MIRGSCREKDVDVYITEERKALNGTQLQGIHNTIILYQAATIILKYFFIHYL